MTRKILLFPLAVLAVIGMAVMVATAAVLVMPGVWASRALREGQP